MPGIAVIILAAIVVHELSPFSSVEELFKYLFGKYSDENAWDSIHCLVEIEKVLKISDYINVFSQTEPKQNATRLVNKFTKKIIQREFNRARELISTDWSQIFDQLKPITVYEWFLIIAMERKGPIIVEFIERYTTVIYGSLSYNPDVDIVHVFPDGMDFKVLHYRFGIMVGLQFKNNCKVSLETEMKQIEDELKQKGDELVS
jgi:hypothetical protein